MQYELRYQVVEAKRHTYQNIIDRIGDEPASRYLEGTLDIEPRDIFHYRPTWDSERELYDPRFSALRLTDSYSFLDPRQYYYTPYVTNRAAHHEEFGKTLSYLESRDILVKLPDTWRAIVRAAVIPLRHYESGGQLISVAGSRFAYGTSLAQCCSFASFDRIGNAQMISRVGLAVGDGTAEALESAKLDWMSATHLQPLRSLVEHIMVADDWAEALLALDMADSLIYPLIFRGLDESALLTGGGAYSLVAQYFTAWFADQRKWVDALLASWTADPETAATNVEVLTRIRDEWRPRALDAVRPIAAFIDENLPEAHAGVLLADIDAAETAKWTALLGEQA
ncbi:phenol 2-monooxygenase [Aldersonia kunmingensis]|uniref:phenol 2-monooxygenase n=1 Tax=Aldersonia kunmingensis TaxID=408066 RepID=UPI000834253C|nr:phenol 2-monooxygenase [Aldersonia kunmingensis]